MCTHLVKNGILMIVPCVHRTRTSDMLLRVKLHVTLPMDPLLVIDLQIALEMSTIESRTGLGCVFQVLIFCCVSYVDILHTGDELHLKVARRLQCKH